MKGPPMSTSPVAPVAPVAPAAPPPLTLSDLQADIERVLRPGAPQTLELSALNIPGIRSVFKELGLDTCPLENAQLTAGDKALTLTGQIALLATTFQVNATIALVGNKPTFSVTGTQNGAAIAFSSIAKSLLSHAAEHVPDLSLTNITLVVQTSPGDFSLNFAGKWPIGAGTTTLMLDGTATITSATAQIVGDLQIDANNTFDITWDLQHGSDTLLGTWADTGGLEWTSFATAGGIGVIEVPSAIGRPSFKSAGLLLDLTDKTMTFTAITKEGVDAFVYVRKAQPAAAGESEWGFAIGIDQGTKPFTLPDLRDLDFIELSDAYLIYASYDDASFVIPADVTLSCRARAATQAVVRGLNFGGTVSFTPGSSAQSRHLYSMLKDCSAVAAGSVAPDAIDLTVSLNGFSRIPQLPIQIEEPSLSIQRKAAAFDLKVTAGISIPLSGGNALNVGGCIDISEQGIFLELTEAMTRGLVIHAPVGINGLVLETITGGVGISFEPQPGATVSLNTTFGLFGNTGAVDVMAFEVACSGEEVNPVYLYGSVPQRVDLPSVLSMLVPEIPRLPAVFGDVYLEDFSISFCDTPSGCTVPGVPAPLPFGIGLCGVLHAFSFQLYAELQLHLPGKGVGTTSPSTGAASGLFSMGPINLPADFINAAEEMGLAGVELVGMLGQTANKPLGHALATVDKGLQAVDKGWVTITGTGTRLGGPEFSFNTIALQQAAQSRAEQTAASLLRAGSTTATASATPPLVSAEAVVTVLGAAKSSLNLLLDAAGLTFHMGVTAGPVQVPLSCTIGNRMFTGNCSVTVSLPMDIPLPRGLGTLKLGAKDPGDAQFNGAVTVTIGQSIGAQLKITGKIGKRSLPGVSIDASPTALEDLAKTIGDYVKKEADTLFADAIADPKAWANDVKSGFITGIDQSKLGSMGEFGTALKGLNQTEDQAKTVANTGIKDLKTGASDISKAFHL